MWKGTDGIKAGHVKTNDNKKVEDRVAIVVKEGAGVLVSRHVFEDQEVNLLRRV